jgi:hypothetical protein
MNHYAGDDEEQEAVGNAVKKLDRILEELDESLIDILDRALNAADIGERTALHEQSRTILARYIQFVDSDPLLAALDHNPFTPLATHANLKKTLQVLDRSLA